MLTVQIAAVGKLKESYLQKGIAEYTKRLGAYAKLQITEVSDEKAPDNLSEAEEEQVKRKEGERLLAAIRPDSHVIALTLDGKAWTSEQWASHITELTTYGTSHLTFVIGGSLGLATEVLQRADTKLTLGPLTFPHQLVRLLLLEQVYRAFKIQRGEPYHK